MISVVKIRMTRIKAKERCLTFLSLGSLFPLFTLLFFPKHENRLDMAAQTLAFPDPLTRILRWSDISPHHKSGRESYLWWAMIKHKQSPDYRSKSPHDITVCTHCLFIANNELCTTGRSYYFLPFTLLLEACRFAGFEDFWNSALYAV